MAERNPNLRITTSDEDDLSGVNVGTLDDLEMVEEALRELEGNGPQSLGRLLPGNVDSNPSVTSAGSGVTTASGGYQVIPAPAGGTPSGNIPGKLILATSDLVMVKCCGKIGVGERICWKDSHTCDILSHGRSKVSESMKLGAWYIPAPGQSLYAQPILTQKEMERIQDWQTLLQEHKSHQEWAQIFRSYKISESEESNLSLDSAHQDSKGNTKSSGVLDRDVFQLIEESKSPRHKAAVDSLENGTLRQILHSHDYRIGLNSEAIEKVDENLALLANDVASVSEESGSIGMQMRTLQQVIGTVAPATSSGSTVWDKLAELTASVNQALIGLSTIRKLEMDLKSHSGSLGRVSKAVATKLLAFERAMQHPASSGHTTGHQGSDPALVAQIASLQAQVSALQIRNQPPPPNAGLMQRVLVVEQQYVDLKKQVTGSNVFVYDGKTYGSPGDVLAHLGQSVEQASVGWFQDVVGILCQLGDTIFQGPEFAAYVHASQKVQSTTLETQLMGAMSAEAPLYLFEHAAGKKAFVTPDAGFGHRLSTIDKFNRGGTPERIMITNKVANLLNSIRGAIAGVGPAYSLAAYLLIKVQSQLDSMLMFIDQWHSELIHQCEYSSTEAWPFIGQCIREIFGFLSKPRIEICLLQEWTTKENKARIIWAVLQVHIRMDEILEARFKSHMTVTTVMSNFIMKTRVSSNSIDTLEKRLKDVFTIPGKMTALDTEVKALKKDVGMLKAKK